jgi:hypothetical protein
VEVTAIETVVAVQVEAVTAGNCQVGAQITFCFDVLMGKVWRTTRWCAGPSST